MAARGLLVLLFTFGCCEFCTSTVFAGGTTKEKKQQANAKANEPGKQKAETEPLPTRRTFMEDFFPQWMNNDDYAILDLLPSQWIGLPAIALIGFVAGLVLQLIILAITRIVAKRTEIAWDDELAAALPGPLRLFLTLLIFALLLPRLGLADNADVMVTSLLGCGLIFTIAWFLLRCLKMLARLTEQYFTKGQENTPHARAIHTQVSVVRVILRFIIMIAAVALALMQFEVARSIGMSLLASAGVAGIAIGFAARSTIESLFAGITIAFTRTIKIGDVVVVEGHWGRIEEIRLTYVVVKIWDQRQLILPVTYFTTKPIENWTFSSDELLGTIYIYTDYTVKLEDVRAELKRILEESDLWDGRAQSVLVTKMTPTCAEVRLLISAADSSKHWDLRCLVREKMLQWLQSRGATAMPTYRIESKTSDRLVPPDAMARELIDQPK